MSPRHNHRGPAVALLLALGCSPPPHVVVRVEDPNSAAPDATELLAGWDLTGLRKVALDTALAFPLQITVSAPASTSAELWMEAHAADGSALARGSASITLKRHTTSTAQVTLARLCTADEECFDDLFCNGSERCDQGICVFVDPPCDSPFPCVVETCVEATESCDVTVDHGLCATGDYCNLARGCITGDGCLGDADCQDAYACNGEEQCVGFRCEGGAPLDTNDNDPCTLDGCDDNRADPIFHESLPSRDGDDCTPQGGVRSVCVSTKGGCHESACGDGVIDVSLGEVCDDGADNSNDYSLEPTCRTDCTGWAPYCGNGTREGGETCDEGTANGSGTGCAADCTRDGTCGDGEVQSAYEDCDDGPGDADNCDGCRTDCQRGCACTAPAACPTSEWCGDGLCLPCDTTAHCGPACATCSGVTPICRGTTEGCVCDTSPEPRGSCPPGSRCLADACVPCDQANFCGQECVACAGNTPVCGGPEVGCIVDPASDSASRGCAGQPDFTLCQLESPTRSYNICVNEICVEPGCGDTSCAPPAPHFVLADTNVRACSPTSESQTIPCPGTPGTAGCATTPHCGQDAQYGWDTQNPASARFARTDVAGEPMVQDEVTGLVWQGCVAGLSGAECSVGSGAINLGAGQALSYCDALVWAGYSDWRLPDRFELFSLVSFDRVDPAIDPGAFPATPKATGVWTPTLSGGAIRFMDGAESPFYGSGAVRCLRGEPGPIPAPRFIVSASVSDQPTVMDQVTGLVWQGCVSGLHAADCSAGAATTTTWADALSSCEGLDWGGQSDWRVPNQRELKSIQDFRFNPAVDPVAFPATPHAFNDCLWSSTSTTYLRAAWCVEFGEREGYGESKNGAAYLRCVREGP